MKRSKVTVTIGRVPHHAAGDSSNGDGSFREKVVRHVDAWMARERPQLGIDALLSRPLDAMLMALEVAGEIDDTAPPLRANYERVQEDLREILLQYPNIFATIDSICRTAMNARKRGELRSHASSPGTRAAATRRSKK